MLYHALHSHTPVEKFRRLLKTLLDFSYIHENFSVELCLSLQD